MRSIALGPLVALSISVVFGACSGGLGLSGNGGGSAGEKAQPKKAAGDDDSFDSEDEPSSEPVQVAGAFLACGGDFVRNGTFPNGELTYGCGFFDKDNKRVADQPEIKRVVATFEGGAAEERPLKPAPDASRFQKLYGVPAAEAAKGFSAEITYEAEDGNDETTKAQVKAIAKTTPASASSVASSTSTSTVAPGTDTAAVDPFFCPAGKYKPRIEDECEDLYELHELHLRVFPDGVTVSPPSADYEGVFETGYLPDTPVSHELIDRLVNHEFFEIFRTTALVLGPRDCPDLQCMVGGSGDDQFLMPDGTIPVFHVEGATERKHETIAIGGGEIAKIVGDGQVFKVKGMAFRLLSNAHIPPGAVMLNRNAYPRSNVTHVHYITTRDVAEGAFKIGDMGYGMPPE